MHFSNSQCRLPPVSCILNCLVNKNLVSLIWIEDQRNLISHDDWTHLKLMRLKYSRLQVATAHVNTITVLKQLLAFVFWIISSQGPLVLSFFPELSVASHSLHQWIEFTHCSCTYCISVVTDDTTTRCWLQLKTCRKKHQRGFLVKILSTVSRWRMNLSWNYLFT